MEMKGTDLIKVIDACGKNGVSHIKIGDVEISFNGFVIQTESDYPKVAQQVDEVVTTDPNFDLQERVEVEGNDTEMMMLNDPLGYEEAVMRNELEDSETMED